MYHRFLIHSSADGHLAFGEPLLMETDVQPLRQMTFISMVLSSHLTI